MVVAAVAYTATAVSAGKMLLAGVSRPKVAPQAIFLPRVRGTAIGSCW